MAYEYDASKEACPPQYSDLHRGACDAEHMFCACGPGGRSTNIENNEKGILEAGLFNLIAAHEYAALGSEHDSHKQGIYTTNSVGDND